MTSRSPAFLDANILMYAIGEDHPYKRPCVTVLKQIEAEALQVVTSVEVLQEIFHRYHSLREYVPYHYFRAPPLDPAVGLDTPGMAALTFRACASAGPDLHTADDPPAATRSVESVPVFPTHMELVS